MSCIGLGRNWRLVRVNWIYHIFVIVLDLPTVFNKIERMHIRKSSFDPTFWEVVVDEKIIQEIKIEFPIYDIPESFANLEAITVWLHETEYKRLRKAAFNLLARKSYSKALLLKKLREKKFSH